VKPIILKRSFTVRFSSDGELCAATSRDVKAFHVDSGRKMFAAHPFSHPSHLAFAPSANVIAVKSTSGRIGILDALSGAMKFDCQNDSEGEGSGVEFAQGGRFIVDGSWSGFIRARETENGRVVFERRFAHEMIQGVAAAVGGSIWLSSHSPKATARDRPPEPAYFLRWAWPLSSADPEVLRIRVPFLRSSALSPDGRLLAVIFGAPPTTLQIFSLPEQTIVHSRQVVPGGTGCALRWSKDSGYLGFVNRDRISVIEAPSFDDVWAHILEYPSDLDFSPDAALVALGSWSTGKIVRFEKRPNKALEPTPTSVTDRAAHAPRQP
jgi:hypothetical protein